MAEFPSWRSYRIFEFAILYRQRFILDAATQTFLETVLATSKSRDRIVPAGTVFWRAQLGHDWMTNDVSPDESFEEPCPYPPERMKPLKGRASEGRANPKGIPYLYMAFDHETAMAEVRPWVGSYVSVGRFTLLKDARILDTTIHDRVRSLYIGEPTPERREMKVWSNIDEAFSEPVMPSDLTAEYTPTQILAEFFKSNGFDGIAYRSSLGSGHNIVLFDLDAADLIACHLFNVKKVSFVFSEATNPYLLTSV